MLNRWWVRLLLALAAASVARRLYAIARRKSVNGKLVLITGGASGLGRQLAIRFARNGARVVLWDINQEGLQRVAEELEQYGTDVSIDRVNLADRSQIYAAADKVKDEMGKLDILVNNAGIVSGKTFLDVSDDMAQLTLAVNTAAHFWTAKAFLPDMLARNSGHIVTIASAAGMVAVRGLADYCASKFGAFGFDEALRMEMRFTGKSGVKTTCICPYYINTGMFEGAKTRFKHILPILDENYVADCVFDAVREERAFLALPASVHYLLFLGRALLPTWAFDWTCDFLGVNNSMDDFVGRKGRGGQKRVTDSKDA